MIHPRSEQKGKKETEKKKTRTWLDDCLMAYKNPPSKCVLLSVYISDLCCKTQVVLTLQIFSTSFMSVFSKRISKKSPSSGVKNKKNDFMAIEIVTVAMARKTRVE